MAHKRHLLSPDSHNTLPQPNMSDHRPSNYEAAIQQRSPSPSYADWHRSDDVVRYKGGYKPVQDDCFEDVLEEAAKSWGGPDSRNSDYLGDELWTAAFEETPANLNSPGVQKLRKALEHIYNREDMSFDAGVEPEVHIEGFIEDPEESEFHDVWKKVLSFLENYEWYDDEDEDEDDEDEDDE